ncbi:hypothetical protein Btru_075897 [Bulinus truncatus]|nr:hypothetical protein Btru_075897 [Bulinus truncatus]
MKRSRFASHHVQLQREKLSRRYELRGSRKFRLQCPKYDAHHPEICIETRKRCRRVESRYHKILDPCIQKVLKQRKEAVPASLTAQDLFYRKVSNIHEIAQQLVTYEKEFLTGRPSQNIVTTILAVNALLEAMLHHALKYRQDHCDMYAGNNTELPEFIPWTATTAMRKIITEQIGLILEKGLPEAREVDVQGTMFQNIVGLADIFLDGYASQLKSLQLQEHRMDDFSKLEREFDRERQKLILPLLECKQYDRAASLAEKFEDFEILVKICDLTDGQDRLQKYRYQFADRGFSQFLYNWYLKEGKRSHLLSKSVADEELSQFLDSDDVKYLSWLHEIRRGNFQAAHSALATLANVEKNFLSKKKTLLSLSKLSALASEEGDDEILQENIEAINEELGLVLHQEALPEEVLHNVGMDPKNMRVMSPEELIQLYVSEHNTYASELDVKKALDLLHYVEQGENFEQLKLHILCRAILMDSWDDVDVTDPLEVNKNKIFFRTLDLVHMDDELDTILPDRDTLLSCEELAGLQKQPNFIFLIKAGYEQIQNALQ